MSKLTLPVVSGDRDPVASGLQVVGFDHAHFLLEHLETGNTIIIIIIRPERLFQKTVTSCEGGLWSVEQLQVERLSWCVAGDE